MTDAKKDHAPKPVDSASSDDQEEEKQNLDEIKPSQQLLIAKGEYDLPGALQGIAAVHPRSLGGALSATLLMQHVLSLSNQLAELKKERDTTRETNDQLREGLHKAECRVTRLETLRKADQAERPLKNASIVVGTILFSAAVSLAINDTYALAVASGILGIVLLFFGIRGSPTQSGGEES